MLAPLKKDEFGHFRNHLLHQANVILHGGFQLFEVHTNSLVVDLHVLHLPYDDGNLNQRIAPLHLQLDPFVLGIFVEGTCFWHLFIIFIYFVDGSFLIKEGATDAVSVLYETLNAFNYTN